MTFLDFFMTFIFKKVIEQSCCEIQYLNVMPSDHDNNCSVTYDQLKQSQKFLFVKGLSHISIPHAIEESYMHALGNYH